MTAEDQTPPNTPLEPLPDDSVTPENPLSQIKDKKNESGSLARFKNHLKTLKGNAAHWMSASHFSQLRMRLANVSTESILVSLQEIDPDVLLTKAAHFLQKSSFLSSPWGLITICSFFISNVTALIGEDLFPVPKPLPSPLLKNTPSLSKTITDYQIIFSRNLFNSQGLIPGEDIEEGTSQDELSGVPIKSSLSLNLIGTLVLENKNHSVAHIEDKAANINYPVQIDDEIPEKIRVLDIEARKVIFLNLKSRKKEYIEMIDQFDQAKKPTFFENKREIQRPSKTQFNIPKARVDKALGPDFGTIITQARAIPNYENGTQAGFKLIQIVPGSIYEELGIKEGDIVLGINGTSINDVAKATEMFHEFKNSKHVELQLNKNGKVVTHSYDIQ